MKNIYKILLRIAEVMALAAIIGFSFTACDGDGNSGNDDPALSGSISISPDTGVTTGATLTANYTGDEAVSYQWKIGKTNVGTNQNTHVADQAGNYTVTVSAEGYKSKTSAQVSVTVPTGPQIPSQYHGRWARDGGSALSPLVISSTTIIAEHWSLYTITGIQALASGHEITCDIEQYGTVQKNWKFIFDTEENGNISIHIIFQNYLTNYDRSSIYIKQQDITVLKSIIGEWRYAWSSRTLKFTSEGKYFIDGIELGTYTVDDDTLTLINIHGTPEEYQLEWSYDNMCINLNGGYYNGGYSRILPDIPTGPIWPEELLGWWGVPGGNNNVDDYLHFYNSTGGSGAAGYFNIRGYQFGFEYKSIVGKTIKVTYNDWSNDTSTEYTLCTDYTITGSGTGAGRVIRLTGGDSIFAHLMNKDHHWLYLN